ncbi:MAG TPA: FkbM family methyltransferase [Chitinophagaceae bacterium]|nr:FkbM family methyltransferase [Chitinophagaceae bacterium]
MAKNRGSFLSNVWHGAGYRARKLLSSNGSKIGLSRYKAWKLKHLPYNSPHTYDLKGTTIHFNNGPELLHSLKEIFIDEVYRIPFKTSTPYIIDCGANIGLAILYITRQYPQARIVAFEPDSANFFFLQKNIQSNQLTNVELRKEAVWNADTTLQFASEGTLGSRINQDGGGTDTIAVKATRLKNLLTRPIDFLKMDIEGAEYEVLKDCADSLHLVDFLFIEFHGYFNRMHELTEILQIVQSNQFAYYIREAAAVYPTPFYRSNAPKYQYDIQLNIFCFKNHS